MLWYAREGAYLVHAGEAIALSGSDETESMRRGHARLSMLARERNLPAVERFFAEEIHRTTESKLEALLSALWRLRVGVLDLFSPAVQGRFCGSERLLSFCFLSTLVSAFLFPLAACN